jgi:hypothetical protein
MPNRRVAILASAPDRAHWQNALPTALIRTPPTTGSQAGRPLGRTRTSTFQPGLVLELGPLRREAAPGEDEQDEAARDENPGERV